MKSILFKFSLIALLGFLSASDNVQEFQGEATYISKATMDLGSWGARMSEAQKKEVQARLKNRLEKTYVLSFNKEESFFKEEDKLDAMSGATDTWGKNFTQGDQYKNVKENTLVQSQEFYGKQFLVKDKLQAIEWKMAGDSKQIGQYLCFKATASIPTAQLTWYNFSWSDISENKPTEPNAEGTETLENAIPLTQVEAWYTLQIPVSHGPSEYWGLPGLILEVSAGNTVMLCSKIVMNPKEKLTIVAPAKGKEITKREYRETIQAKMIEMRNNRGRGRQ